MHKTALFTLATLAAAATPAMGQFEYELAVSREQAAGGSLPSTNLILGGFGEFNGQLYATLSQNNSSNGRITAGLPGQTFNVLVDGTQLTFAGIDPEGFTLTDRIPTTATGLLFADALNDQVVRYDVAGDAVAQVLSSTQIQAATGATNTSLGQGQATLPGGDLLFYDGSSDTLLRTNGTAGNVSTFISPAQFAASPTRGFVTSDSAAADVDYFARVGDTLYFGNDSADRLFSLDTTAADPASTIQSVLAGEQIQAVTGFTGSGLAGFDAIEQGPDGFVYFYEDRADSILRFDPASPSSTLELVLSESQLLAGPAGTDFVGGLVPFGDDIYFYTTTGGLYRINPIPEPASLAVAGLAGLTLLRRRRA